MTRIALATAALLIAVSSAAAQKLDGQGNAGKDLTNCPPPGQTTGAAPDSAQAVEKSAILPSAGGHEQSAAPTVQRDGKAVEARTDCAQDPGQAKPKG